MFFLASIVFLKWYTLVVPKEVQSATICLFSRPLQALKPVDLNLFSLFQDHGYNKLLILLPNQILMNWLPIKELNKISINCLPVQIPE